MKFLEARNSMMETMGWDRRVATLATRLALGVDTWNGIADCSDFLGRPLLSQSEAVEVRKAFAK